jgi:hypothetical protein
LNSVAAIRFSRKTVVSEVSNENIEEHRDGTINMHEIMRNAYTILTEKLEEKRQVCKTYMYLASTEDGVPCHGNVCSASIKDGELC